MGGASDRESNLVEPNEARSAALVAFLSSPEAYGGGATSAVSVAETHISWVFLTDSHAYKVKKPVRFPFLDYSTLEQRRQACRDEVRLNNRLAAGTYRGVVPICESPGGKLKLAGEGDVIEYCVQMQRLPADRMLDRLIHDGRATGADIDRLLGILVPFYRSVAHGPEIAEHGSARAIEANARENMNLLEAPDHFLPRATLQRVRASQLQFLQLRAELFAKRAAMGRVCEGHGDLRPEHVCMMEQPVVFDCLEFSLALRSADVANELAFLAMEFDYLGVPELGHTLINGYRAQSGDDVPDGLVSFFKSYRACVRGKVEELRAAQQTNAAAERSRARARRYLQLASSYAAEFYRPKVFVMVGASGTGKSTICEALSNALGLEILRTDAVRRELAGFRQPDADYREGIYSVSMTSRTYQTLFRRAGTLLADAVSIVLDGTFLDSAYRDYAVQLARRHGAEAYFIYCQCPRDVARQRITRRIERGEGQSDARPELFDLQQKKLRQIDWAGRSVVVLDTTASSSESVAQVINILRDPASLIVSER